MADDNASTPIPPTTTLDTSQPTNHDETTQSQSFAGVPKTAYVMNEMITTEWTYVRELETIIEFYVRPFEELENTSKIPTALRGQTEAIFGNIRELYHFHKSILLPEFVRAASSPIGVCHIFIDHRRQFLRLYRPYCQNKPNSETLRREHNADGCRFFADCQRMANHQLPLSAYLLKPIQRITKYQLLLKQLQSYCAEDPNTEEELAHAVKSALAAMMDLLAQINDTMKRTMPRYDTINARPNTKEADPCWAAEARLKRQKLRNRWFYMAFGTGVFLILLAALMVFFFVLPSNKEADARIGNATYDAPPALTPSSHSTQPLPPVRTQATPTPQSSSPPEIAFTVATPAEPMVETATKTPSATPPNNWAPFESPSFYQYSHISPLTLGHIRTSDQIFESCDDYRRHGFTQSGVYRLLRPGAYDFLAQCIMDEGGGADGKTWMVLQRRTSAKLEFESRTFSEYSTGFGDVREDHWLGLRNVRSLIEAGYKLRLRMEIEGDRCEPKTDPYYFVGDWEFRIDAEKNAYTLHVSHLLSGNFTNPLHEITTTNGLPFHAGRRDSNYASCLETRQAGGWWITEGGCTLIALNGAYECPARSSLYSTFLVHLRNPLRSRQHDNHRANFLYPRASRMMLHVCRPDAAAC